MRGEGWDVYYAFFVRIGFTDAARAEAKAHDAWLVDLATLDRDFRHYCGTVGTIAPQANKWVTR